MSYRGVTAKDPAVGAHAMTIIGYSIDYFVIENSWGKEWGDSGLGYIHKDHVNSFFEAWVIRGFDAPVVAPVVPEPAKKTDFAVIAVAVLAAACLYVLTKVM